MNEISVTTKLNLEDFKRISFYFLYRKTGSKVALGIGVFLLLSTLAFYSIASEEFTQFPFLPIVLGLSMSVLPPFTLLRALRKNYNSNPRINESITYQFDENDIIITGESFHSVLSWKKTFALTETKNFILIWQTGQTANVIPKRDLSNQQISEIKEIANSFSEVKKKL